MARCVVARPASRRRRPASTRTICATWPCQLNVGPAKWEGSRGQSKTLIDLRRYRHLVLTVYLLVLLWATLAPVPSVNRAPVGFDKFAHVGLFGGLAFLIFWYESWSSWAGAARAFLLAVGAALLIEVLQAMLPFRDADLADLVAGALGAILGVAAAALLRSQRPSRRPGTGP